MRAGTRNIYYLCAPNRHLAEHSPYYEAMKKKDTEVGERWVGQAPGAAARWGVLTFSALCWVNLPKMQGRAAR